MKIGLNLVGKSYVPNERRDWTVSIDNIKKSIIDVYNIEHTVSVYICTYETETTNQLIEQYNPVKTTLLDFKNSEQRLTYIKSLKELLDEDLDIIISTRFDIFFYKPFSELNIDFTKVNFLFRERGWWDSHKFTTDNIFIIPKQFLPQFIESVQDAYDRPVRNHNDLHPVYSFLLPKIGEETMHIISNEHYLSNTNEYYTLTRHRMP